MEFNIPEKLQTELTMGPLAAAYAISDRINPFYLRGDFDGDGKPDYAILEAADGLIYWTGKQFAWYQQGGLIFRQ